MCVNEGDEERMSENVRFTARQRKYIRWLAQGQENRQPDTEAELARLMGVTDRTLRRWERRTGFVEAVHGEALKLLGRRLPDILDALYKRAVKGDVPAIKLALAVTERQVDTRCVEGDVAHRPTVEVVYVDRLGQPHDKPPYIGEELTE